MQQYMKMKGKRERRGWRKWRRVRRERREKEKNRFGKRRGAEGIRI